MEYYIYSGIPRTGLLVVRTQEHVLHRFASGVVATTTVCTTSETAVHQPRAPVNDIAGRRGIDTLGQVRGAAVHGAPGGTDGTRHAFNGHVGLVGLTRPRQRVTIVA
jgi:hypothetical protein